MGIIEHGLWLRECMRYEPQPSALSNSRDHKPRSIIPVVYKRERYFN